MTEFCFSEIPMFVEVRHASRERFVGASVAGEGNLGWSPARLLSR
jgi:hypothetical protein